MLFGTARGKSPPLCSAAAHAPMAVGSLVSLLHARLSERSARRRLTARGISAMLLLERSSSVRVPPSKAFIPGTSLTAQLQHL